MYPGISVALQVTQLTLATLLHNFKIASPSNEPVDMTEKVGLTNQKATPLVVHLTPRLHAQFELVSFDKSISVLWYNNGPFNFPLSPRSSHWKIRK